MIFGQAKRFTANTASITAPIGGWNARDSLAAMPPTDAVTLTNMYPTPTDVQLRLGYTRYSQLTTSTGVQNISSITYVSTTATLTTASAHGLSTGARVSITGTTPANYSGIYVITVTGATTFTYTMLATPSGNASVVGAYTIGITTAIDTLMNYAGTNSQKLFAVAGTFIYDCSTPTATAVQTVSNDRFQYINFSNTSGDYIVACNGTDPVTIYNGTTWFTLATTTTAQTISTITRSGTLATLTTSSPHNLVSGNFVTISGAVEAAYNGSYVITVTGTSTFTYTMATTPAANATVVGSYSVLGITGVNSNRFVQVNLFKNRIYFVEKDSMTCWYLDVNAISGLASPLYFGAIARDGGFLQAMGTWTLDAGEGADDYAVFITNMGEIIVYNGTDPDTATEWLLKGVWQVGYVFSRRCFFKWAGDLLILTQGGLLPLSGALQSSRLDPRVFLTDKIFYEISKEADLYANEYGWQIIYFAKVNMLLINIPNPSGTEQYVMHTISKSWANFTGINANVFEMHNDSLYFGGNGFVGKYYDGFSDDGNPISATCQQAYTYFDMPGQQKRFTMVRPTFLVDSGAPGIFCGVNTDYQTQNNLGEVSFNPTPTIIGVWDAGTWDENNWAGNLVVYRNWQGVTGLGYAAGINLNIVSKGIDVHWVSTDYVMEKGSVL
jgi:hypothetical protein